MHAETKAVNKNVNIVIIHSEKSNYDNVIHQQCEKNK